MCDFTGTKGSVRIVALSGLALAASAHAPAAGQGVKLNDPLPVGLRGHVDDVLCSPDGQRVVFRATAHSEGEALFSAPTKGGTPVVLVDDPRYARPRISPDSRLVHYIDQGLHVVPIDGERSPLWIAEDALSFAYVPGSDELLFSRATGVFALPLEGGTPVPVAVVPAGTAVLGELSISADGRWVVFLAASSGGRGELYSAAVDGSTGPLRLNGDLVSVIDVGSSTLITPDSLRVVYRGFEFPGQVRVLYSVPIDGSSAPVKLNGTLAGDRSLTQFALSRDGSRVLYLSDQDRVNVTELYSAPVAGGEPAIKLNSPLLANRDVSAFLAADGGRVVYKADQASNDVEELFVVGTAGPATPVRLSHAGARIRDFSMTADGRRAVYVVWGPSGSGDLFSVSIQRPGMPQRLTELASDESTDGFTISSDSARVAYLVQGPETSQLYSVPIGGGPRTRLDDGGFMEWVGLFTPDAGHVLYVSDRLFVNGDSPDVKELFSVASSGGAPVQLSPPVHEGIVLDDVSSFQFGALGTRGTFVVRHRDDDDGDEEELYGVQLEPRSRPALLATTEEFDSVLISPDEEWAAYTVSDGDDDVGLFGVPMDGSRTPELLSAGGFDLFGIRFGPDGRTLFYSQDEAIGVYRVPIDSSEPRQELTGWALDRPYAPHFELSADGSTIVVQADALVEGEYELFSLPSDGGSPPVQLNDLTAPHGSPNYRNLFQISADGTRVVYATDEVTDQTMELFSVPIDGSAPSVRVSGPLPAGTVVVSFVLVPESDRIVFVTRDPANHHELWSVPTDGSAPPVQLVSGLPVDYSNPPFRVAPGGTQVVFRADLAAADVYELFVVPIDGSAPSRRLNGTLVPGGDVHPAFELDGTGTRAVYRADEKQDEVFELFSAPLGVAAAPLQITGPHVAGGDVVGFRTVPGGRHVVFTADHDTDDVFELYFAPVDQVKEARRLSGPLVDGGDVHPSFAVDPGGRVVYIADQDENSVHEVYLSSTTLSRSRPPAATRR